MLERDEAWSAWPVNWSAVWAGALTAIAAALILGLIGTASGTVALQKFTSWRAISWLDVSMAVCAAFFAFAAGGWVAGKISGLRHAEPAILHAVIAWLVALPILIALVAIGAGSALDSWYGGFAAPLIGGATGAAPAAAVVRATALAGLTSILLGLMGAVIGGWIASGEPMTLTQHRSRPTRWLIIERKEIP